jgi:hypothetical protein
VINRPSHMKELFRVAEPGYFNYIDEFIWRNVLGG